MDPTKPVDLVKQAISLEPAQKALSLVEEFKNFALKGNVIDLAVGVIIGAAFGKIVDSLVKSVMMPVIGIFLPGDDSYLQWKWTVQGQEILYGQFLGELLNFLIVALALFVFIVKFLGWVMRARMGEATGEAPPTTEERLLTEIRDILKQRPA
jgi:large conductance mechanosensitive channel